MAGRAADIQDVSQRLLCRLAGVKPELPEINDRTILVAEDIPPSVLINLDRRGIAGFATVLGGPTSHVAILARSMGIPAVAGLTPKVLVIPDGNRNSVAL